MELTFINKSKHFYAYLQKPRSLCHFNYSALRPVREYNSYRMMTNIFFAHNSSNYYCLDTFGASSVLRCLKKGMECNMKLVDGFLCYLKEASLFQST